VTGQQFLGQDDQMAADEVIRAEREIDESFEASDLVDVGYAQALWTLLSMNEDAFLKNTNLLPAETMHVFVDNRINELTYPLRACLRQCKLLKGGVRREMIDDHYQLALKWLKSAGDYSQFCSMFPLWYRGRIKLAASGNRLLVDSSFNNDKAYEAYNRLIKKEGRPDAAIEPSEDLLSLLIANVTVGDTWFRVNFSPALVSGLVSALQPSMANRHTLPDNWQFNTFTLEQYRKVLLTIQAMLYGWHLARDFVAQQGMVGLGYPSSVWMLPVQQLAAHLKQYTDLPRPVIAGILDLITFGSNDIRDPDIATQPLVDLRNGFYVLSPFVFLNINVERNLCTLLNQIPKEREKYLTLVDEKETAVVEEMKEFLAPINLEFKSGAVKGTDVDLAIIDRANKVCLCLELKWFIEPAEIREVEDRTKELMRGVVQAKKIGALFEAGDDHLLHNVLKIDSDYTFLSAVGSVNWIGFGDVQEPAVPIIKVWHLLKFLKDTGSLSDSVVWLKNRQYLPRAGSDYSVEPRELSCGRWSATWYGIKPLEQSGAV
jgi:hypothetical protein